MVSIYSHTNPVAFLKDFISQKRLLDKSMTIAQLAKLWGLNSGQVLADILSGKRELKNKFIPLFIKGCELDESEELYFQTMVYYLNANTAELKKAFKTFLATLNPGSREELRVQDEDLYSKWINVAILTLSRLKDFELSTSYICSKLAFEVPEEEVQKAIHYLLLKNYLKPCGDGKIKKSSPQVTSRNGQKINSTQMYYSQVCDLAKMAISFTPQEREFQCFSMAIKEENLKVAKQLIQDFRKKLANLCESDSAEQVYQANIMFFPLTKKNKPI